MCLAHSPWKEIEAQNWHISAFWRECSLSTYWESLKPKAVQSVSWRTLLHQTKVMLNLKNWMSASCLNIELLRVNAMGETRSSSKTNWHHKGTCKNDTGILEDIINDVNVIYLCPNGAMNKEKEADSVMSATCEWSNWACCQMKMALFVWIGSGLNAGVNFEYMESKYLLYLLPKFGISQAIK